MVRTGRSAAVGTYRLQSAQAQGRYVVQVLEPNSTMALQLQASRQQVLAGGSVELSARLVDDGGSGHAGRRHGSRAHPAGRRRGVAGGARMAAAGRCRWWPARTACARA